ncbi:MAG: hypothetical protein AB7T06_24160 [Kofleriaceae bacterium]
MSDQEPKRKKPDDFFGIPGSGWLAQSAGTFADEAGFGVDIAKKIMAPAKPAIEIGESAFPALDLLPWEKPMMPTAAPGLLDKAMPWLSLAAGVKGVASGAYGLATGEGRALDNSLGIVSGIADTTAGVTGLAALTGAEAGLTGGLAAAATPAGIIAGLVGLGVYGEKESTAVMQNDMWGDTINDWFTDDSGKPVSMYEAAWDQGGDMIDASHDYMASTWLGEDVGGALGTIGGGIGAGATLAGATAANIGIGAVTAATDVAVGAKDLAVGIGTGAYNLGAGAAGAISDAWNSDWW